jgi:hypothetical protein
MNCRLYSSLLLVLSLTVAGGIASAGELSISGVVTGYADADEKALDSVRIELRPIKSYKGKSRTPAPDLVGVALTQADGSFVITELASPSRRKVYPLMEKWTYRVKVVTPGHYVFDGLVDWDGKDEPWDFMLEAKVTDVVDDSGIVAPDDRELQRGATRRGQ